MKAGATEPQLIGDPNNILPTASISIRSIDAGCHGGAIPKRASDSTVSNIIRVPSLDSPNITVKEPVTRSSSILNTHQILEMARQVVIPPGNPYVLDAEFVEVECEIRGIKDRDQTAVRQLALLIKEEEDKIRPRPKKIHTIRSTQKELLTCNGMMNVLIEDAAAIPNESGLDRYYQLLARSAHLGRRVERLVNICEPHPNLSRLIDRMTQTFKTISAIQQHVDIHEEVGAASLPKVNPFASSSTAGGTTKHLSNLVEDVFMGRNSNPYPMDKIFTNEPSSDVTHEARDCGAGNRPIYRSRDQSTNAKRVEGEVS